MIFIESILFENQVMHAVSRENENIERSFPFLSRNKQQ